MYSFFTTVLKRLIVFLAVLLCWLRISGAAEFTPELLEKKSLVCREVLKTKPVHYYTFRGAVVAKEIVLCAYSLSTDRVETVSIKSGISGNQATLAFNVLTPGYRIERVRGQGITHFYFKISGRGGEELILLDGRHLDLETKKSLFYFPFDNIFLSKKSASRGYRFLLDVITFAQNEICALGVKSRAYPGSMLCELFNDRFIATLIFIEQADDGEFFNKCPALESLPLAENRVYANCPEYAIFKTLTHIDRNREKAYSAVASRKGARGITQFMNTKQYPTYGETVRDYPEANLIPDYRIGSSEMRNAVKATICYLDKILRRLPQSAREEFRDDFIFGGLFLITGYNGGPEKAKSLYHAFHGLSKNNWKALEISEFKPGKTVRRETAGYIEKYLFSWPVIEKLDRWLAEGQY